MSLESRVLERVRPDAEEKARTLRAAESLISRIEGHALFSSRDMEALLVGSVQKDTYLNSPDMDVFLVFPQDCELERMASVCSRIGDDLLEDTEERFADHPYVHGTYAGHEVDLVPCYAMEEGAKVISAVDRTPLHTRHITERISERQKDEARLLKAFMKGIGVYGADSRHLGFSGYLVELLVLHYGDFLSVLEAGSSWRYGGRLGGEPEEGFEDGPLLVIDPVDTRRNVASALHVDSFSLFVHACKRYLERKDERFFFPRERRHLGTEEARAMLEAAGTRAVTLSFEVEGITEDNIHSQGRRTEKGVAKALESHGFSVLRSAFVADGPLIVAFELEDDVLPASKEHCGPPVWMEHSERFLRRWSHDALRPPFIEEGRWRAVVPRDLRHAKDFLIQKAEHASIGSGLRGRRMYVLDHEESLHIGNMSVMTALLDSRLPWDI